MRWRKRVDAELRQLEAELTRLRAEGAQESNTTPARDDPEAGRDRVPVPGALLWAGVIVGGLIGLGGVLLRTFGVSFGVVYGARPVQLVTAVGAAGLTMAISCWWLRRLSRPDSSRAQLTELVAFASAIAAFLALTGILLPAVPVGVSDEVSCPRVLIRQTAFQGAVAAGVPGVNARSDPNRAATQLDRYPSGCLLGFDGFCFGQPVTDAAYTGLIPKRQDTRWLRLARNRKPFAHWLARLISSEPDRDRFIAGAVIQTRTLEGLSDQWLEREDEPGDDAPDDNDPDDGCPGSVLPAGKPTLTLGEPDADGVVTLTAGPGKASDLRYAVLTAGEVTDVVGRFRPIEPTVSKDGLVSYLWRSAVTASVLQDRSTTVAVAAVPCIAPSIIPLDLATVDLAGGTLTRSPATFSATGTPVELSDGDLKQLAEAACQAVE